MKPALLNVTMCLLTWILWHRFCLDESCTAKTARQFSGRALSMPPSYLSILGTNVFDSTNKFFVISRFCLCSGFTSLSEKFAKQGQEGIENFSCAINETFDRILAVVLKYGGDLECFAGDALLILFPTNVLGRSSSMASMINDAFSCGVELCSFLSPISVAVGDTISQLHLHGAVSFGTLTALVVGTSQQGGARARGVNL